MSIAIDSKHALWSLLRGYFKTRQPAPQHLGQGPTQGPIQGLTIMECLVAILLIGLTVAMVTPPLLIATATRVQNRRAEQALMLAQDEIDRISTLVQQGTHENRRLPLVATASGGNLQAVGKPTQLFNELRTSRRDGSACPASPFASSPRYTNAQVPIASALPVDVDGDCNPEFFMQVFRTAGVTTTAEQSKPAVNQRPAKFDLGIRVYSYPLARANLSSGKLETEPAPLLLTNSQGKLATRPLVAIYKPIAWSEQSDVLCESLTPADKAKIATCQ